MSARAEILVIDDDEQEIAVARRALEREHLADRVEVSTDPERAFDDLSSLRLRPRAVLLDLRMHGLDGKAFLRRLREDERTRTLPVVVLSTSGDPRDVEECYRLGANSYVQKDPGETPVGRYLVEVVRYWLDLNRAPGDVW